MFLLTWILVWTSIIFACNQFVFCLICRRAFIIRVLKIKKLPRTALFLPPFKEASILSRETITKNVCDRKSLSKRVKHAQQDLEAADLNILLTNETTFDNRNYLHKFYTKVCRFSDLMPLGFYMHDSAIAENFFFLHSLALKGRLCVVWPNGSLKWFLEKVIFGPTDACLGRRSCLRRVCVITLKVGLWFTLLEVKFAYQVQL